MLTFLCGTGHVVYTMFPIIADIALKRDPPGTSDGRGVGGIANGDHRLPGLRCRGVADFHSGRPAWHWTRVGILEILAVSVPASLFGVTIAALWSLRRGKDLADDMEFRKS